LLFCCSEEINPIKTYFKPFLRFLTRQKIFKLKRYEYQIVEIKVNNWSKKPKEDLLEVMNEYGDIGWKFICFEPSIKKSESQKIIKLVFEREIKQ